MTRIDLAHDARGNVRRVVGMLTRPHADPSQRDTVLVDMRYVAYDSAGRLTEFSDRAVGADEMHDRTARRT